MKTTQIRNKYNFECSDKTNQSIIQEITKAMITCNLDLIIEISDVEAYTYDILIKDGKHKFANYKPLFNKDRFKSSKLLDFFADDYFIIRGDFVFKQLRSEKYITLFKVLISDSAYVTITTEEINISGSISRELLKIIDKYP